MKNKFLSVATVCIAIIAFASCNKPVSQLALYVPKDATVVFTIDTKTITDKIASSGITIDSLANLFSTQKEEFALHWNDIKNSGIDLNKPFYIFSKQSNSIQEGNIKSGALIAEVQDAGKLEMFLKKENADGHVLQGEKYKYMAFGDDYMAGWNDKVLIISVATAGNSASGGDTLSKLQLATLFTQKESASIADVDEFMNTLQKPGDIHFYTNASNSLNAMAMPGMSKANELLQGSYSEGVINFEKGKMTAAGETHYNKTLGGILDKYPSKEIDVSMIKNYPGLLSGFGIISFNPKVLIDILHYLGFDVMADSFAFGLGFTTGDVVNSFSGDIAFMFSPRSEKTMESTPRYPGFLLNLAIGDKTAFDKVLTGLLNKEILTKHGDEYQLGMAGGHGFVIETANNSLLISSSDELIKAYQSPGNKNSLPADIEKKISNKSSALYVDINNLLLNKATEDTSADIHWNDAYYFHNMSEAAKETFKNFIATTDKSDGKTIQGNFELNFVNTNENSLASLTKFLAIAREEKLKHKNGWAANPPVSGSGNEDSLPAENNAQ